MSRWISVTATSPSGKTLFICRHCGRKSVTPDVACYTSPSLPAWHPQWGKKCQELEEEEKNRVLHPLIQGRIYTITNLADKLRRTKLVDREALLRRDRSSVVDLCVLAVLKALSPDHEQSKSQLQHALQIVREDVLK